MALASWNGWLFTTRYIAWGLAVAAATASGCANSKAESSVPQLIVAERGGDRESRTFPERLQAAGERASLPREGRAEAAYAAEHADSCPLRVAGANVRAEPVDQGVAFVFTTYGDGVPELRKRVRELAYTHVHSPSDADEHRCGCPLVSRDGVAFMSEASTSAEPLPRGARLVLTPNERNELARLRERVFERLGELQAANCPLRDELLGSDRAAHRE